MIARVLVLLALVSGQVQSGTRQGVDEIGTRSYCLETGTCPPADDGFARPAPGLMFLAVGMVGLGIAIWRVDRAGRRNA
jgi:hypothetical protein